MTNKELLDIIKLAQTNQVKADTLRKILAIVEVNGEVKENRMKHVFSMLSDPNVHDSTLLDILGKVYHGKDIWPAISLLVNYPSLKEYLVHKDFTRQEWSLILDNIYSFSENPLVGDIYLKWLKRIGDTKASLEEFKLFHDVFATSNNKIVYSNYYWNVLLDPTTPFDERKELFDIISRNILQMEQDIPFVYKDDVLKRIVQAYKLYGFQFADTYATIIFWVADIPMPIMETEEEKNFYITLFDFMCLHIPDGQEKNLLNTYFYQYVTNKDIPLDERLAIVRTVKDKELIMKDNIIKMLIDVYKEKGIKALDLVRGALVNNGIRKNKLCREFLMQEESREVLKLASRTFKINRIRHDNECMQMLARLKSENEKLAFLQFLRSKYPDQTEEDIKRRELERKREVQLSNDVNTVYNDFLKNRAGYQKLTNALERAQDYEFSLVRKKKNER